MKPILLAVSRGIAVLVLMALPAYAGEKPVTPRPYVDAGTDAVLAFYAALLQEEPPTREQELALFRETDLLWVVLALAPEDYKDEGTEPMTRTEPQRENYRRRMEKVAAAGPVALTYFREHKEWFLPKNVRTPRDLHVAISGTIHMLCSIADPVYTSPASDVGFVEAIFIDDLDVPGSARRRRIIRFPVRDGRINAAEIELDTFVGEAVVERRKAQEPALRQAPSTRQAPSVKRDRRMPDGPAGRLISKKRLA